MSPICPTRRVSRSSDPGDDLTAPHPRLWGFFLRFGPPLRCQPRPDPRHGRCGPDSSAGRCWQAFSGQCGGQLAQ